MRKVPTLRSGLALTRAANVGAILLLGLLIIAGTGASKWTYHVAASTWGGTITFRGEGNDWLISRGTRCAARAVPDLRAADPADDRPCPPARFEAPQEIVSEVIEWREGTRIHFRRAPPDGRLVIRALDGGTAGFPADSQLVIPADVWQGHGALVFTGSVRIGGDMGTGAQDYLIGGQWEARQIGFLTSLVRDITEVVQKGELTRGASVQVVVGAEPVISYGHITPAGIGDPGLEVVALSERGRLSLQVAYFGLARPILFRPDWMDRILSSPVLIALTVLLTLILMVTELLVAIFAAGRGGRGEGSEGRARH